MTNKIETSAEEERSATRSRRALLGLGAVAVGTAALAAGSKEAAAKGDLSISDVSQGVSSGINNTISAPIKSINETLGTAFHAGVGVSFPSTFQEVISCILGGFGLNFNFNGCQALLSFIGGPFSILQTARISGNMERIWKKEDPGTDTLRQEDTLEAYQAAYEGVTASQATTATLAEAQGPLGAIDEATLVGLHAAAEAGHLIEEVALVGQLQYGANERLGMILQALNAQTALLSHLVMENHNRRRLDVEATRKESEVMTYKVGGASHTVSGR